MQRNALATDAASFQDGPPNPLHPGWMDAVRAHRGEEIIVWALLWPQLAPVCHCCKRFFCQRNHPPLASFAMHADYALIEIHIAQPEVDQLASSHTGVNAYRNKA